MVDSFCLVAFNTPGISLTGYRMASELLRMQAEALSRVPLKGAERAGVVGSIFAESLASNIVVGGRMVSWRSLLRSGQSISIT